MPTLAALAATGIFPRTSESSSFRRTCPIVCLEVFCEVGMKLYGTMRHWT